MFHQGVTYNRGEVYEVTEATMKAIDKADYEVVGDNEEVIAKPKKTTKGAPEKAENK